MPFCSGAWAGTPPQLFEARSLSLSGTKRCQSGAASSSSSSPAPPELPAVSRHGGGVLGGTGPAFCGIPGRRGGTKLGPITCAAPHACSPPILLWAAADAPPKPDASLPSAVYQ